MRRARQDRAFGKKALWVCVCSLSLIPAFAAAQQPGADQIRRTYGTTPAYEADTYRTAARDENGVRLTVNGRPIDLSGIRNGDATPSADPTGGAGGQLSRSTRSGRLPMSTLINNTAIANNISINNVRNSTISITQSNIGPVTATTSLSRK